MSNTLSTSVNNLPAVDASTAPPITNDPVITDVLAEMEQEVANATHPHIQQAVPQPQYQPSPQYQPPPQPRAQPPQQYHTQSSIQTTNPLFQYNDPMKSMPVMLPPYIKQTSRSWIDAPKMKTAILASVLAVLLLIPSLGFVYEKFERISMIRSYELPIRVILLAIVLYVTMIKLEI